MQMDAGSLERELKFVAAGTGFPPLPPGYSLGTGTTLHLTDEYLADAAGKIEASGFDLRRRSDAGGRVRYALKGRDAFVAPGVAARREIEAEAMGDGLPPAILAALAEDGCTTVAGSAPLLVRATLRQERTAAPLSLDGKVLATMSIDRVALAEAGVAWNELEIEFLPTLSAEEVARESARLTGWISTLDGYLPSEGSKADRARDLLRAGGSSD